MPGHPAAHAQGRQRFAVGAVALLLLVAGVGIALFTTSSLLPRDSVGEGHPPQPVPPAGSLVTGAVEREVVRTASPPARAEQAIPAPTAVAGPAGVPMAPSITAPASARASAVHAASRYGRFSLVGEADAAPGREFGSCVAIEGDLAVIGAPGYGKERGQCGAAYVYERRNGVWAQTERLDSPHSGFAHRVAIASGAIVVLARDIDTYVRDGNSWRLLGTLISAGPVWDAVAHGDMLAISRNGVQLWRRVGEEWQEAEHIDAPPGDAPARFGRWLSLDGNALAVHSDCNDGATYVYRRVGEAFARTPDIRLTVPSGQEAQGVLAANGTALLQLNHWGVLAIDERSETGWNRTLARGIWDGSNGLVHNERGVAADGALVVSVETGREVPSFVVWQRRDDGWYRTTIAGPDMPRGTGMAIWHPRIALSGRTVVATTRWDPHDSGRAWFFDITDDDLARATKIEPVAR